MHIDKRYVILLFAYGNFWSAVCISLQAPFFPKEAERKGASATQYGLVFGVYELGIIVLSPLFGKLTSRVKTESMISLGLLIVGAAVVVFGFVNHAPNGAPFVYSALAVRFVESIGCVMFNVFNFTKVAALYPDAIASSFSVLQTGYGVGLLAGPTIGALLYDAGGFTLPFATLGSFLLLGALASFVVLPLAGQQPNQATIAAKRHNDTADTVVVIIGSDDNNDAKDTPQAADAGGGGGGSKPLCQNDEERGVVELLANASCALDCAAIVATFAFIGFNAAALEPHLRQFSLSVVLVGLMFIIDGGIFAVSSPIVGKLCDAGVEPKQLVLAGHVLSVAGICLIGPLPFIEAFSSSLPAVVVGLALVGLGVALKFVPSFFNTLREAVELRNFPDDKRTYALVTSVVYSSGSLGSFVGPSIGGYLYQHVGYRLGSCVFALVELCLFCVALAYYVCVVRPLRRRAIDAKKRQARSLLADIDAAAAAGDTSRNAMMHCSSAASSLRLLASSRSCRWLTNETSDCHNSLSASRRRHFGLGGDYSRVALLASKQLSSSGGKQYDALVCQPPKRQYAATNDSSCTMLWADATNSASVAPLLLPPPSSSSVHSKRRSSYVKTRRRSSTEHIKPHLKNASAQAASDDSSCKDNNALLSKLDTRLSSTSSARATKKRTNSTTIQTSRRQTSAVANKQTPPNPH